MRKGSLFAGAGGALVLFAATPAAAYLGPGVGLGVVATLFGAIAAFILVLAGLIWYPVKVMLRKMRGKKAEAAAAATTVAEAKADGPKA